MPTLERLKVRRGWMAAARAYQDPDQRRELLSREGVLIQVKLRPDFVPGVREFTWNGAKVPWRLESGGALADIAFVRQIADTPAKWETVPEAYLPEKVEIEIRLRAPIPYDSFRVKVRPFRAGADDVGHAAADQKEFTARKTVR